MSEIQRIRLDGKMAEPLSHYTDAVIFDNVLWISGMLGVDVSGKIVGKGDVIAQTEQVFKNIKTILDETNATFSDVVRVMVYLVDVNHRGLINPVRQKYFGDAKPVSTLVEISALADPDALIEIEVVAYLGHRK